MKVLMLPPYCYPEQISSSHLTEDLLETFSKYEFEVEMHAPTPCRGIDKVTRLRYKKIKTETRFNGTVHIHRFGLFAEGKNTIVRAIRYVLCNVIQFQKAKRIRDVDLIYAASTPPTQGFLCAMVKKKLSKQYGRTIPFVCRWTATGDLPFPPAGYF